VKLSRSSRNSAIASRAPNNGWVTMMLPDKPRREDWRIEMSPEVQAKIDADPKKAEALRIVLAEIRQALDGVATGIFADADEALRALGAKREGEE
jgi:hypothetical protein